MYVNDFDQNGTIEHLICAHNGDTSYPLILRHDLVGQIPSLKKKYLKYENFKNETLSDIFTPEQLKTAIELKVFQLESSVVINDGRGKFTVKPLPLGVQFAPVYGIEATDFDRDGILDLLVGGNLYNVKPEAGRYDGSCGLLLKGDGKGNFKAIPSKESGINIDGEVRDILTVETKNGPIVVVSRNNDGVKVYRTE
jgi:hypothetical protein